MKGPSAPYIFDEFLASKEETLSPFLTKDSRSWGHFLSLKSALLSAFFLILSFAFSFTHPALSYLFLTMVYFLVGTPALINSIRDLVQLDVNIDVLMTLAAFLSISIGSALEGGLLLVLFELSGAMEEAVSKKTKSALMTLQNLAPRLAYLEAADGSISEVAVQEVETGMHILIKAGEIVPLDGTVIKGSSFVNMMHLSGESVPLPKTIGDTVQAGARNLDGTLTLEVTRTSSDSTLSRIITLITQAQESKPQVAKFLDRFSRRYATSVILLFLFFAISLPFILNIPFLGVEGSLYRALTFLIAASPCALIIATPTAYLSAISACARKGILLKGGAIFDAIVKCHHIALDKTGTLTTGKLVCENFTALTPSAIDEATALAIAASLEAKVNHPIAEAIVLYAKEKKTPTVKIDDFQSIPGFGIKGKVYLQGATLSCCLGHLPYILSIEPSLKNKIAAHTSPIEGEVVAYLLIGSTLFVFKFKDAIKEQALQTIHTLKDKYQFKTYMLTGDHKKNALSVAQALNVDEVFYELTPEDKFQKISKLSKDYHLMMVGDGVNDAPALAKATVGISMGKIGSATAIEASDVVILNDDLYLIAWLYKKATNTLSIVKQNLTLALAVICLATTPALLGFIPLWLSVILHEGGTLLVGLNSLRLLKK